VKTPYCAVHKNFIYEHLARELTIYSYRFPGQVLKVIRNIDYESARDIMSAVDTVYADGIQAGREKLERDAANQEDSHDSF